MPNTDKVLQRYLDPFPPIATVRYKLHERGYVILVIYSLAGEHVKTLVNEVLEPGIYHVEWDGRNERGEEVDNGAYLYKMLYNGAITTRNILLIE